MFCALPQKFMRLYRYRENHVGDNKNYDWSAWAACIYPVHISDAGRDCSERRDNMKQ